MGAHPGYSGSALITTNTTMTEEALNEIEREYQLGPIRGAHIDDIEAARHIRATTLREQERDIYNGTVDFEEDPLTVVHEAVKRLAGEIFPIPDAYTILTQARINAYGNEGVISMTAYKDHAKEIAWRYIAQLEELQDLDYMRNIERVSQPAAKIARLNIVRGCRERISKLSEEDARPYREAMERLADKDVTIETIKELNDLIEPRRFGS